MSKRREATPIDWQRINGKTLVAAGGRVARVITWDEFVLKAYAIGRHIHNLTEPQITDAIQKSMAILGRNATHRMTQNFMMSRLEAMARGQYDWKTGRTTHFTSDTLREAEQQQLTEVEEP